MYGLPQNNKFLPIFIRFICHSIQKTFPVWEGYIFLECFLKLKPHYILHDPVILRMLQQFGFDKRFDCFFGAVVRK